MRDKVISSQRQRKERMAPHPAPRKEGDQKPTENHRHFKVVSQVGSINHLEIFNIPIYFQMLPRKKFEALKSAKAFPMVIYSTSAEGQELLSLLEAFYQADI